MCDIVRIARVMDGGGLDASELVDEKSIFEILMIIELLSQAFSESDQQISGNVNSAEMKLPLVSAVLCKGCGI